MNNLHIFSICSKKISLFIILFNFLLSEDQVKAILELRLQRLTELGKDEIETELKELVAKINEYLELLCSKEKIIAVIID